MVTQYITFGQIHRHPETNKPLHNHVVKIMAPTKHLCRAATFAKFGNKFSTNKDHWDKAHFPSGIYETIIVSVDSFKGETAAELVPKKRKLIKQHFSEVYEDEPEKEPEITPGEDDEPKTQGEKDRLDYLGGD